MSRDIILNFLLEYDTSLLTPSIVSSFEKRFPPIYKRDDEGHRWDTHIKYVIEIAIDLAKIIMKHRNIKLNMDMVYAAAALHDIVRYKDPMNHEMSCGKYVRDNRRFLSQWFNKDEIEIIAQAVEDHRASVGANPRSVYGCITFDADRISGLPIKMMVMRAWYYGRKHNPEYTVDEQFERIHGHLSEKYGYGGYANKMASPEGDRMSRRLWTESRKIIANKKKLRKIFDKMIRNREIV